MTMETKVEGENMDPPEHGERSYNYLIYNL